MRQQIAVPLRNRLLIGLAVLLALCLGLAACNDAPTSSDTGPGVFTPPARAYVTATPTATIPTTSFTLTCAVRIAEGSEEDATQHTITCKVTHAPTTDTVFTLHYSVRDPSGNLHQFTPTCDGALRNGAGSCSKAYQFIFPFAAIPGPITGESLPSHQSLGPIVPIT